MTGNAFDMKYTFKLIFLYYSDSSNL